MIAKISEATSKEATLAALIARRGFALSDVPVLQPAEPFIELSGEDIRRRLFLVAETGGDEQCLRPEFTIPAARAYIDAGTQGTANVAFIGKVFRQRADGPGEFVQGSVESFGRGNTAEADADMLALALETDIALGGGSSTVHMSDVGLMAALIGALGVPAGVARKIRQHGLEAALAAPEAASSSLAAYSGVMAALKGADPAEARAFVKDLLSIAGIKASGGRTPQEIADRFLEKSGESGAGLTAEQRDVLARFQAIAGNPHQVAGAVRALAQAAGLDLATALNSFEARTAAMLAKNLPVETLRVSAALNRNVGYYTGFVFEVMRPGIDRPAIAGGRYDGLLKRLGAATDIPAVGCAIWLERFGADA